MDMPLEVLVVPVSDVDRAKDFYAMLGWRLDADRSVDRFRLVQATPPGSGCSVQSGIGLYRCRAGVSSRPDADRDRRSGFARRAGRARRTGQRGLPLRGWHGVPVQGWRRRVRAGQRTGARSPQLLLVRQLQRRGWKRLDSSRRSPPGCRDASTRSTRRSGPPLTSLMP